MTLLTRIVSSFDRKDGNSIGYQQCKHAITYNCNRHQLRTRKRVLYYSMNKKRKVAAKKVICCVPKHSLMQFTCFTYLFNTSKCSFMQVVVSVYAVFNERDVWFQELKTKLW